MYDDVRLNEWIISESFTKPGGSSNKELSALVGEVLEFSARSVDQLINNNY